MSKQSNPQIAPALPSLGSHIEWSMDGELRSGILDFIHTDEDGCCWLFVSLLDGGWAAVNLRYAQNLNGGQNRFPDTLAK